MISCTLCSLISWTLCSFEVNSLSPLLPFHNKLFHSVITFPFFFSFSWKTNMEMLSWEETMVSWFLRNESFPTILLKLFLNVPCQVLVCIILTIKMIGHHSSLRDMMGQSYSIYAQTCTFHQFLLHFVVAWKSWSLGTM